MPLESYTSVDSAGKPLLGPEESIAFTSDRTQLFLRAEKSEGMGTLYVTTKHLIWQSLDGSVGYRMDYPYVLLHAVSRDTSSFPHPCLYAQLDDEVEEEAFQSARMRQPAADSASAAAAAGDAAEDEEDEAEEPNPISDLRFVPENSGVLDALYRAVSECAALNPDSDLSDGEGDFMYNADEVRFGSGANAADEDGEYGEGGDDGAAAYAVDSNQARLAQLAMRTGISAEEMFADDDEEEEGEEEAEEAEVEFAKGAPADGQAQLASAAQQVAAASAAGAGAGAAAAAVPAARSKRERDAAAEEEEKQNTEQRLH
jgi:nucleotide-sensitive chloride channel 1A